MKMKSNCLSLLLLSIILLSSCSVNNDYPDYPDPSSFYEVEFRDVEIGSNYSTLLYVKEKIPHPNHYDCRAFYMLDLPPNGILNTTISFQLAQDHPRLTIGDCARIYEEPFFYYEVVMDWDTELGFIKSAMFPAQIADSLDLIEGSFILSTPTDGDLSLNERSGIWFQDASGNPTLTFPEIDGWFYDFRIEIGYRVLPFASSIDTQDDPWPCTFCDNAAPGFNSLGMDFLVPSVAHPNILMPIDDLSGAKVTAWLRKKNDDTKQIQIMEAEIPNNAPTNASIQMKVLKENLFPPGTVRISRL